MTPEQAFGQVIRTIREEHRLSQEKLALESGYTREYISMIERGLKGPTIATIFHLARALSSTPTELVRRTEDLQPAVLERER